MADPKELPSRAIKISTETRYFPVDDNVSLVCLTWFLNNLTNTICYADPDNTRIEVLYLSDDLKVGALDIENDCHVLTSVSPLNPGREYVMPINFESTLVKRFVLKRGSVYLAHLILTIGSQNFQNSVSNPILLNRTVIIAPT